MGFRQNLGVVGQTQVVVGAEKHAVLAVHGGAHTSEGRNLPQAAVQTRLPKAIQVFLNFIQPGHASLLFIPV
jgi:hypothetical protein